MNSIFRVIFLRFLGMLALSFFGTLVTRAVITRSAGDASARALPGLEAELQHMLSVYRTGGPQALRSDLSRLGAARGADLYLVDAAGKDLISGADRADLLRREKSGLQIPYLGRTSETRFVRAGDKSYSLIVLWRRHFNFKEFFSYYAWTFVSILLLSWWLAIDLGSPLRQLRLAVEQFGRGNLAVRVASNRVDEIGEVARAFDHMAARIENLLTAERRLLQDVSHELRSPLARLSCAIELARTSDDREAATARIHKESRRLNSLVNQLLEVTSAEGDPAAMRKEPIELNQLVRGLIDDCLIEAKGCRFAFNASGDVLVLGDVELLRRAIENILRNAIRYAPPDTLVEVAVTEQNGRAAVRIRDYGIGVPPELLANIFKPFFRVESHRGPEGVGLGLALAQRAVSLHQGVIRAENAFPGLVITMDVPAEPLLLTASV